MLGDRQMKDQDFSKYDFPIRVFPLSWSKGQLWLYIKHFWFSWKVARLISKGDAAIVYCFSIHALMTGVFLKMLKPNVKMVFDSNELFIECFQHKVKKLIWLPVQRLGVKFCDLVIHAESNRLKYYLENHGGRDKRHEVLENFPNYRKGMLAKMPQKGERVRVIYFGILGRDRYTLELANIFHELDNYDLDIVGYFAEKSVEDEVMALLEKSGKTNVRVLPGVHYTEMPKLLEDYHIGIALYQNTNVNNYYCAPNKVYDYLMNGLCVVANNYPGLVNVLEGNCVGACVEKIDTECMTKALDAIVEKNLWKNIQNDLRYTYSWDKQKDSFLDWVENL
jgi:glycosyltransferase involved in cell wall biosynthesis